MNTITFRGRESRTVSHDVLCPHGCVRQMFVPIYLARYHKLEAFREVGFCLQVPDSDYCTLSRQLRKHLQLHGAI
jgi:hypothetical protein